MSICTDPLEHCKEDTCHSTWYATVSVNAHQVSKRMPLTSGTCGAVMMCVISTLTPWCWSRRGWVGHWWSQLWWLVVTWHTPVLDTYSPQLGRQHQAEAQTEDRGQIHAHPRRANLYILHPHEDGMQAITHTHLQLLQGLTRPTSND